IRDFHVTGVQTCALPILSNSGRGLNVLACAREHAMIAAIFGAMHERRAAPAGGSNLGFWPRSARLCVACGRAAREYAADARLCGVRRTLRRTLLRLDPAPERSGD